MIVKLFKIFILFLMVLQIFTACETEPDNEGSFDGTEEITILSPANGGTISLSKTEEVSNGVEAAAGYFRWESFDLSYQDTQNIVFALFTQKPVINQKKLIISNMDKCAGGTRTGRTIFESGDVFEVSTDELYLYSKDKGDFTTTKYAVEPGTVYYWIVWALDDYGNIGHSSKIYTVSFVK